MASIERRLSVCSMEDNANPEPFTGNMSHNHTCLESLRVLGFCVQGICVCLYGELDVVGAL